MSQESSSASAGSGESNDDLPTPRVSQYGFPAFHQPSNVLDMNEDYFSPPPPSPKLAAIKTPSQLLSLQAGTAGAAAAAPGLQSKATIAISLPEGVYAQQQDGVTTTSAGGSVTTAPSFSDSTSIKSTVPTISTNDNDVESMLGEILEESVARFGALAVEELADDDTDDDEAASEDEEGLTDGSWSYPRLMLNRPD